jgi:hypothetical protein
MLAVCGAYVCGDSNNGLRLHEARQFSTIPRRTSFQLPFLNPSVSLCKVHVGTLVPGRTSLAGRDSLTQDTVRASSRD